MNARDSKKFRKAVDELLPKPTLRLSNPSLTKSDKNVIDAFVEELPKEGRILSSDGRRLDRIGAGAEQVAAWVDGVMVETSTESTKLDQQILRYLRKKHGKRIDLTFEHHTTPEGYGWVKAFTPGVSKEVGKLEWSRSSVFDGKYYIHMIKVNPLFRRRGVATSLYRAWMTKEGIKLDDLAPTNKSEEGKKFRKAVDKLLPNPAGRLRNPAPVKVDHKEIARLAARIRNLYIRSVGNGKVEEPYELSLDDVTFPAVGGPVTMDILIFVKPGDELGISGSVSVMKPGRPGQLPAGYWMNLTLIGPWIGAKSFLGQEIERVLLHEATHVGRIRYMRLQSYSSLPAAPTEASYAKYFNDPEEVEARAQEIAVQTLDASRRYNDNPQRFAIMSFDDLIETSETWRRIQGYLTPANKRLIREKVARVLNDANAFAPGHRQPAYKRQYDLLDTLTMGVLEQAAYPKVSKSAQAFFDALKRANYDFRKMPLEYIQQRDRILSAYEMKESERHARDKERKRLDAAIERARKNLKTSAQLRRLKVMEQQREDIDLLPVGMSGLWDSKGRPTRKHLELIMWGYSPDRDRLDSYIEEITSGGNDGSK